jgi:transketolase
MVEILVYLYFQELNIDPKNPKKTDRDIFLLSKGHGALALYATLCERGFFSKEFLMGYDKDGGTLPEHASTIAPGVELSTGSLGHALPVGNGFSQSFLNDNKTNRVFVFMSDGELNEGSNWEAIMYAGQHKLKNLTVIVDLNGFQGYSETKKVIDLSPIAQKLKDFGWDTYECDGHDLSDIKRAFGKLKNSKNNKPNFIIAKTVKGKGVPFFEGKFESHYKAISTEQKEEILSSL